MSYILQLRSFIQRSPHIQTIRERMTLGKFGEPVSAGQLNQIFKRNKEVLDQAVEFECGHLSHFEVSNYERFCVLLGNILIVLSFYILVWKHTSFSIKELLSSALKELFRKTHKPYAFILLLLF